MSVLIFVNSYITITEIESNEFATTIMINGQHKNVSYSPTGTHNITVNTKINYSQYLLLKHR